MSPAVLVAAAHSTAVHESQTEQATLRAELQQLEQQAHCGVVITNTEVPILKMRRNPWNPFHANSEENMQHVLAQDMQHVLAQDMQHVLAQEGTEPQHAFSVNQLKYGVVPAPMMTMQSGHAPALPAGWEQKVSKGEAHKPGRTTWVDLEAVAKGNKNGDSEMSAEVAAEVAALAEVEDSPFANASENQAKAQKPSAAKIQQGYSAANLTRLDIDITRLKAGLVSHARQKLLPSSSDARNSCGLARMIVLMLLLL
jgi:hypothetical protein